MSTLHKHRAPRPAIRAADLTPAQKTAICECSNLFTFLAKDCKAITPTQGHALGTALAARIQHIARHPESVHSEIPDDVLQMFLSVEAGS